MRKIPVILTTVIIFLVCSLCVSLAEEADVAITAGEEWSWDPGANNIFDGKINLKDYIGQELIIHISSDLPYQNEEGKNNSPVFMIVNGKRITVMKQTDSVRWIPSEDDPVMKFTARLTMPDEKHVYRIMFQFIVNNEEGNEIAVFNSEIKAGEDGTAGPFYIPADIGMITSVIFAAAAAVWIAALLANRCFRKKNKTGE